MAGAGRPQERSRDRAAADTRRPRTGAGPPQKKFTQRFRDSAKSQLTSDARLHPQRPCPSTSECGCSPGSTGPFAFGEPTQPLPGVLPAGEPPLPVWPKDRLDVTLLLGICLSHQSTNRSKHIDKARLPADLASSTPALCSGGSESRAREPNGNRRRKTNSPRLPGRCRASGLSRFGGCWSPRGPRRCCLGRAGPGRSAPPPPKTGWLWRSGPPAVMVTRKVYPLKRPGWPRSGPRRT